MLVQDAPVLALAGEDVQRPAAPWMLGMALLGAPVEPLMMLSWTLGVPGQGYSVDAQPADVHVSSSQLLSITQDGWQVEYLAWEPAGDQHPSLPTKLRLSRDDSQATITVLEREALMDLPADYVEFKIL
jgi:outer membrane biogenesis lipoprotein LolB